MADEYKIRLGMKQIKNMTVCDSKMTSFTGGSLSGDDLEDLYCLATVTSVSTLTPCCFICSYDNHF